MSGIALPIGVFEAKDPCGRKIVCGRVAWHHICREHPDLASLMPLIKGVVEHPDEIYQDADIADRDCYYRFNVQVHNWVCSLKVVVVFGALSKVFGAHVVTAFEKYDVAPGNVKRGERKLWP
jgi:hypothetical protein